MLRYIRKWRTLVFNGALLYCDDFSSPVPFFQRLSCGCYMTHLGLPFNLRTRNYATIPLSLAYSTVSTNQIPELLERYMIKGPIDGIEGEDAGNPSFHYSWIFVHFWVIVLPHGRQ